MLKVFNYLINLIVTCYCAHENGATPNNGIMCASLDFTEPEGSGFCGSDEVCTGTTEDNFLAVDVSNKGDLCTKGKFQYYY